jgi:hypothetical protein
MIFAVVKAMQVRRLYLKVMEVCRKRECLIENSRQRQRMGGAMTVALADNIIAMMHLNKAGRI